MSKMKSIHPGEYKHIVFFTGAVMSAESRVPAYRGRGGIWSQYRWEECACQDTEYNFLFADNFVIGHSQG